MKAVVLAGGEGIRLQPFTLRTQKQLLPVGNRPVLAHVLTNIARAGITDVGLVIGGSFPDHVRAFVGDGSRFGINVTYIHQEKTRGLADAVRCARSFVGSSSFLIYFGDSIIDGKTTETVVDSMQSSSIEAHVPLQEVDDPGRYGIASFDDESITGFVEKPDSPPSNWAYVGVVGVSTAVFDHIDSLQPSERGELELTDALDRMVRHGCSITWHEAGGTWIDVGTPIDLLDANEAVLAARASAGSDEGGCSDVLGYQRSVGEAIARSPDWVEGYLDIGRQSTVSDGSEIRPPVSIGRNTVIRNGAVVGPYTSIGDDCVVESATVEWSVLLDGVTISTDDVVENCVVDQYSIVEADDEPTAPAGQNESAHNIDH